MANIELTPQAAGDGAGPYANHIVDDTINYSTKISNGVNLRTFFQRRNSTGEIATSIQPNNANHLHDNDDQGIGMGGDVRAIISARRAAAARAAMATAAAGYHVNSKCNEGNHRNRGDPLRMSQLERDLYNVATGKSSVCIVAAKRRASISSCVSAVSLPEELRDGGDSRFGEEFEDDGGWEEDYHQEKEDDGNYELDEDYEDYEIYNNNDEHEQGNWLPRALKVGQIMPTTQATRGRQVIINGDIHTLDDQDIKSLKSSVSKTNQEAIQTIIDLKMQLAQESSSKDELSMKLKQVANEKSEIERKLDEMRREKERLDALFNERNVLKKEVQSQQQQQQQQGRADANASEFKSGGKRNKRASWCAAMPNTSTCNNGVTSHFSSSMTKLTALVSELDNSITLRDLMDDKVTANAETSKNKPPQARRGSGLDFSIMSLGTRRRSSSVFSGSLSALFSEAAVCPSEDNGNDNDNENRIDASDTKGDASVPKSLYSNDSSLSNTSGSIHSKLLPSTVATAATSVTAATTITPGISKAPTSQDITSLMQENTKLLRDNVNLSSENLQLKSDLEFLKKALENVLQNNDLTITSTGISPMDSKVMEMLYNGNDVNDCVNDDRNTSYGKVTENFTTENAPSNKHTTTLSSRTGFQRGRTIDSQSQVQSSTKTKLPQLLQDWSARDADAEIRLENNLEGNFSTHSNDFMDQDDGTSVDSEYSDGESSISIGDDTIRRELREVNRKFSSFSASVRDSANPRAVVTRRSSLPAPTFVETYFGSDIIADEEAQVSIILDDTNRIKDQQRRLRTKATRNHSLPPSVSSSQQPSCLKSLSFRRYAPARSNSIKISGETGQGDDCLNKRLDDSNNKNGRNSIGLRKQSSLLLLQERLDSDDGMSVPSCDDDDSWVSNGNGVMVKLSQSK